MSFDGFVVVREVTLPCGVHGAVREDPDGIINVYVNSKDTKEEREKTYLHEIGHYRLGHIGSGRPVCELEVEAEKEVI